MSFLKKKNAEVAASGAGADNNAVAPKVDKSAKAAKPTKAEKPAKAPKAPKAPKQSKPKKANKSGLKKNGKYLAMDFGSYAIKFAQGSFVGGKIQIEKLFSADLPKDIYKDGVIQNHEEMSKIIKKAINDNGVKVKDCIVTMESSEIIKRELVIPDLPHEDAIAMVTYEIERYLPINIENYVLQYKVLSEFVEEENKKLNILVGALPRSIAEGLFNLLRGVGLSPEILDINSNVLENVFEQGAVINNDGTTGATVALVDMGYNSINVTILDQGKYKFNRIIKSGGRFINDEIAQNAGLSESDSQTKRLSLKERSLLELVHQYAEEEEPISGDESSRVIRSYIYHVNHISNEVDKIFKYFTTRSVNNDIDQVYIYGGDSMFADVDRYMGERLNKKTDRVSNIQKVSFANPAMEKELPVYLNAISSLGRQ